MFYLPATGFTVRRLGVVQDADYKPARAGGGLAARRARRRWYSTITLTYTLYISSEYNTNTS